MRYCPYCSEPVSQKARTCSNCKRMLDMEILVEALDTTEESEIKKSALRKIKAKENMRFVWPGIAAIIGFIAGGIIFYLIALAQFSIEKGDFTTQADSLNTKITSLKTSVENAKSGLQSELDSKEKIIDILSQQRESVTRIINFTRRFAESSVISAGSEEEVVFFRNNFIYLRSQFLNQQDVLDSTDFRQSSRFNLKTIPQFLED